MKKRKLPARLLTAIRKQAETGFPLLIFFPHIAIGQDFAAILGRYFPDETIGFVSSQTEERSSVVQDFREGRLRILVSTTILERGVTFPKVDVFVLWSNHRLYTKSSLVQIAGRVGRAFDRPTGQLIFFHDGLTRGMKKAVAEIKATNKKGGFG
jgi:competence protein ComFA